MSLILEEMRRAYVAQRGVSQGAGITLICRSGGWEARFDCAKRSALVLGERGWPCYFIGNEEMARALSELTKSFSVALVDTVTDESGTRFVLIHKVMASASKEVTEPLPDPAQELLSMNVDDY